MTVSSYNELRVCVFLLWRSRGKLLTLVPGCFFVFRFFPVVLAPACE